MKSDPHHIAFGFAAGGAPGPGFPVAVIPVQRISAAHPTGLGQGLNVFDQAAGKGYLRAHVRQVTAVGQAVSGIVLIIRHPVVFVENFVQIVQGVRVGLRARIPVAAVLFQPEGFIHLLILTAVPGAGIGPVNGLVHVPQICEVHVICCGDDRD